MSKQLPKTIKNELKVTQFLHKNEVFGQKMSVFALVCSFLLVFARFRSVFAQVLLTFCRKLILVKPFAKALFAEPKITFRPCLAWHQASSIVTFSKRIKYLADNFQILWKQSVR